MIRTANKIYGEINDLNTVLANSDLGTGKLIVGNGNKGIKTFTPGPNQLLIVNENGEVDTLPLNLGNKAIGTNEVGDIVLIDRDE